VEVAGLTVNAVEGLEANKSSKGLGLDTGVGEGERMFSEKRVRMVGAAV